MTIPPWPQADERESELLHRVLESGQWGGFHPFIAEFERSFAAYQHTAHGVSACNGTVTLEMALSLIGVGEGDEVIVPAISFVSTATAVSRVGARPVFADICGDSYNLNLASVRASITPKVKAILAVHFGGVMCDVKALDQLCRERGLTLLEDAAHAHGAEWLSKRAGSFGRAGSFSFQNGKVLTAGEGGMLVTSDDDIAERARSVANCGRVAGHSFYEHHILGSNYRLSAFQAAVLMAQFERLPEQIKTRTVNARLLKKLTADCKVLVWQEEPFEQTQNPYYLLTGRVGEGEVSRDEFCRRLTAAGVPVSHFYPHTLYENPLYRNGACRVMPCPVAEARVHDAFWIPHRVLLAEEETVRQVAGVLREALSGHSASLRS